MEATRPVRLLGLFVAFALLWAASPGILSDGGVWPLAVLAPETVSREERASADAVFTLEDLREPHRWVRALLPGVPVEEPPRSGGPDGARHDA